MSGTDARLHQLQQSHQYHYRVNLLEVKLNKNFSDPLFCKTLLHLGWDFFQMISKTHFHLRFNLVLELRLYCRCVNYSKGYARTCAYIYIQKYVECIHSIYYIYCILYIHKHKYKFILGSSLEIFSWLIQLSASINQKIHL